MTGNCWLILPTYNEAANLEAIVRASADVLSKAAPEQFKILVVDDNSPDGTGEIADRLADEIAEVEVLHRQTKDGLGPAYLAGFDTALRGGADYILEMDSDFSHDPADLARLLEAARGGGDLVIGSRYTSGGAVADWGLARSAISRGGCRYAKLVLGVDVADLTGGFKCFRRSTLEAIDLASVCSAGYAFQVELTYRVAKRGLQIVEVPIVFRDRRAGTSKMSARIGAEAVWRVPQMRLRGR